MELPKFQTIDTVKPKDFNLLQTTWSSIINVFLSKPTNQMNILPNVKLINGVTVVNHLLGKVQQGWCILDIQSSATIYRSQPFNDKTLTLTSNAAVTVNLGVF